MKKHSKYNILTMSIKIFTMVKNEVDIIEYWIKYHGKMVGYENLYIVDLEFSF